MDSIIRTAFKGMTVLVYQREQNNPDRILTNICTAGPAPEHWFKFELFSQMCNMERQRVKEVRTEHKYHDIVIYYDANKICALELKTLANWWTPDNHILRVIEDFNKIRNSANISTGYVLLITIFADPIQGKVEWMEKQLDSPNGIKDEKSFYDKISQLVDPENIEPGIKLTSINIKNEIFGSLSVSGILYKVK